MEKRRTSILFHLLFLCALPFSLSAQTVDSGVRLKFAAVGDVMLGTNYPSAAHLPPKDAELLAPVTGYLKNVDIAFANMEGTVLDKGGTVKNCKDPSKCYAFRMPEKYVDQIRETGFNTLSIANNHVGDFGQIGRKNMVSALSQRNFCFAGLETRPWDTLTVNGVKYGFCAFAPNTGTVRLNNYKKVEEIVSHLENTCDIVVVSFHGGAEGASHQHVKRKREIFYGENRGNVYEFARMVIDAGADLVFGHGPHVVRAFDIYKNKFIAYSLGNFATYSRFSLRGPNGIAPLVLVETDENGNFISGKIVSFEQLGEGGPVPDEEKRAVEYISRLTKTDIPECPLVFDENGNFHIK